MPGPRDNITFVLVRTQFASNLGSAVRAMCNMGFSRLILVQPGCEVGMEARSYAMRGATILDRAIFLPSLAATAAQLGTMVATSGARGGHTTALRGFAESLLPRLASADVGLVFGSENNGLEKAELQLCQYLVRIPTGSGYSSLNLAQAVALIAYEAHVSLAGGKDAPPLQPASTQELTTLLQGAERLIKGLESRGVRADPVMARLRRMTARADLEPDDVKMLLGLLTRLNEPKDD